MTTPYPDSTELTDNLSIFHLACRHQVKYKTFKDFYRRIERQGWQLHEYLETNPYLPDQRLQRAFLPQVVFTQSTHESLFGETWRDNVKGKSLADKHKAVLKDRLNPNGHCPYVENLLLTQKVTPKAWLKSPLHLSVEDRTFVFTIEWVDLWLFSDNTGILAFKTKLENVHKDNNSYLPAVEDLNLFNRSLRYPGKPLRPNKAVIHDASNPSQSILFWNNLVYGKWLGFADQNVLMWDKNPETSLDHYTRHSKLLTVAQIPDLQAGEKEFLWNRPVISPDFTAQADYTQLTESRWSPAVDAYQRAMFAGYANLREMLLLELATASGKGGNLVGERTWQYDSTYVKKLFSEHGIKVWTYWSGLALRDVCAFLIYDNSTPLMRKQQVEAYYYPLYVQTYHQRFRLDCLSQEIIDHDLHDCINARRVLANFYAFQNQYWFKEVTVDFLGLEINERMKAGLNIENEYQLVKEEILEVSSFVDNKVQAGRQALLAFLIFLFYPFQYLGIGDWLKNLVKYDFSWFLTANLIFLVLILPFWFFSPRVFAWFCKMVSKFSHKTIE